MVSTAAVYAATLQELTESVRSGTLRALQCSSCTSEFGEQSKAQFTFEEIFLQF